MASIFDRMVDQATGSIDPVVLAEAAKVRAAREYGSPDFPPKYLREATDWCTERAELIARQWKQLRGIPLNETTTPFYSYAPTTNE